jgi:hypothetical protein
MARKHPVTGPRLTLRDCRSRSWPNGPAGTFLQNLARDPDGRSWLVMSPTDCAVYRVGPDKSVHTAAQFDRTPTGIAAHPDMDTVAAVGTQGRADCSLARITENGPQAVCDLPDVLGANGMTWAGDRLLVADPPRSVVVAVDVADRTADVWLQHPLIAPIGANLPLPGINGLAVDRDWVLMTSIDSWLAALHTAESVRPAAPYTLSRSIPAPCRAAAITLVCHGRTRAMRARRSGRARR